MSTVRHLSAQNDSIPTDSLSEEQASAQDTVQPEPKTPGYLDEPLTVRKIDRKLWNDEKRGLDYSEIPPEKKKNEPKDSSYRFGSDRGYSIFASQGFMIVFVTVIILLLAFLLFRVFGERIRNKNVPKDTMLVSIEEIEDMSLVPESELERLIRLAVERRDYKEAVRVYYVYVIRELSEKNLILWKKDKTNREYLREMTDPTLHETFRHLTLLFERVWYGDIEIEENNYQRISPLFKTFTETIKSRTP